MSKIKILYIIDKPALAGAQNHLLEVIRKIDKNTFEPWVCFLKDNRKLSQLLNVPIYYLGVERIYGTNGLFRLIKFIKLIKENKIDIVHSYMFSANIFGNLAGKLAGVPIIVSSRRDTGIHREGKWHHRFAYKFAHSLATKVTAVSNAVKRVVLEKEGGKPEKVITIYNGIDLRKFRIKNLECRIKKILNIPEDELVVGMIANFSWVKGHNVLIKAAEVVIKEVPNTRFLLIGEGPLKNSLMFKVKCLKLENKILFLGERSDISKLLSIMDVSVNASYSEGMSNAILESMAAGVPVVATAVDGNLETVKSLRKDYTDSNVDYIDEKEATGILVPPKDSKVMAEAIIKILKNKELTKKMGMNARKLIEKKFTVEIMLKNMERMYLNLAREKKLL